MEIFCMGRHEMDSPAGAELHAVVATPMGTSGCRDLTPGGGLWLLLMVTYPLGDLEYYYVLLGLTIYA